MPVLADAENWYHRNNVWSVAFSPDGKTLATAERIIRLWDVERQELVKVLEDHMGEVRFVGFSSDGRFFASGGQDDGTVLLWEVNVGGSGISIESMGKQLVTWGKLKKTELYQNFPNPFNPETWIPFTLSEPKRVRIMIYTSTGQLVRTLDLGQKPSGAYISKEKAAYWDGRNGIGEKVASGIYSIPFKQGILQP